MELNAIVVMDGRRGIGREGGLLMHLPPDLKYFRQMTQGKTLVMGRKTLKSLPGGRPLPGRRTVILSRRGFEMEGVLVFENEEDFLKWASGQQGECMVAGGGEIYRLLLPYCKRLYITQIDADLSADTFFPQLDEKEWDVQAQPWQEYQNIRYRFCIYERK